MQHSTAWPRFFLLAALVAPQVAAQDPGLLPAPATQQATLPLSANAAAAAAAFQQEQRIPGISVAIATPSAVRAQGFGMADLENDVPATADTVYRLGSISKPVTAVAVLLLVEQQKLTLDENVRTWVPEFPAKEWPITLRQLLGHLAGVRHYKRGESESTVHYATQRAGLGRFASDPLLHEPGTKYLYSTYGYNLAAAAVEVASGQAFSAFVQAQIAGPAGAASLQADDVQRLIKHRAQGYVRNGEELRNSELMDGSYKLGGGGLCSNADDLARFGRALLTGRLLSEASLQTMSTPQKTNDGKATTYGCGLRIGSRNGRAEWSHGGAQARVSTALLLLPEAKVAIAVLCNLEGQRPMTLAEQLADLVVPGESGR